LEQITYKEAADILGKHIVTIRDAVSHGVLTQVPSTKQKKYVIRKQVELFKGKRLWHSALNHDERKQWETYRDTALNPLGVDTVSLVREEARKQAYEETRSQLQPLIDMLVENFTALKPLKSMYAKESEVERPNSVSPFRKPELARR
jgi:hypothetical protein